MALAIFGVPKTTTHGAPHLPGQLGNEGLAFLRGKIGNNTVCVCVFFFFFLVFTNSTVAPKNSSTLTIHCSISKGENVAVLNEQVDVKRAVLFGRSSFPPGFIFGAGSASYQIEGGVNGRGPCIWDTYCRDFPDKIVDKSNGDVGIDAYNRVEEDVKLLKDLGADAYRFSISWARILPKGTRKGGINQPGINYYKKLIKELRDNGIEPYVTLFHWDVPQALEDEYGGFLNRRIIEDFKDYCDVCFLELGDHVKYWTTINEPWTFSTMGYTYGAHAPGRCSEIPGTNYHCPVGDSTTEPYIVGHNLILAHAKAARLYKDKYQSTQGGLIGATVNSMWYEPYDPNEYKDLEAQARALDFNLGWFLDPLVNGDYPFNMRALVRERLPDFINDEQEMIKGSFDFIGLNYYSSKYAQSIPISKKDKPIMPLLDFYVSQLVAKDGVPIGEEVGTWINVYPDGLKDLLLYIKFRYSNPTIYITENGMGDVDTKDKPLEHPLDDNDRNDYVSRHLNAIKEAISAGADVRGYFLWSLTDNFEWDQGYTERYGLHYIDYQDNLKRIPKKSAKWYTNFLKS